MAGTLEMENIIFTGIGCGKVVILGAEHDSTNFLQSGRLITPKLLNTAVICETRTSRIDYIIQSRKGVS